MWSTTNATPVRAMVLFSIANIGLAQWSQTSELPTLYEDVTADLEAALKADEIADLTLSTFQSSVKAEVTKIRPQLLPSLIVLPKNQYGKLDPPAVRYALHRFFLQHRGWRVEGLDPEGAAWDSPAKVPALDRLPETARFRLLRRMGGEGLSSEDALIFAAMIGFFIHGEAVDRLKQLFDVAGFKTDESVPSWVALQSIETYMACYFMGVDFAVTNRSMVEKMYSEIELMYPAWPATREFIHKVAESQHITSSSAVPFAQITSAVEEITDRYGTFQNYECIALKQHLVQMEDRGTGRVRLSSFYGEALGGKWQFQESVEYLRDLGALDESNPGNLRVIIPNYVNGASNCVGASKFDSLCCISECWDLFERIEVALGSAEAAANDVARVVAALPSSTVPANRQLDSLSLVRLQSIATSHGGVVPIHGRLFTQWLHHIYPRECNFPHRSGTTQPRDLYDMDSTGQAHRVLATNEDMKRHSDSPSLRRGAPVENVPWSYEEELLVRSDENLHPVAWVKLQLLATVAAIATMLMGLTRSAKSLARRTGAASRDKGKTLSPVQALSV